MLNDDDVTQVYKCMIHDHALLQLNYTEINSQSQALIDKVNNGIELNEFELIQTPLTDLSSEIKITKSEILARLFGLSIAVGECSDTEFSSQEYSYLSLLIDPADVRFQQFMLIHIKNDFPDHWKTWTEKDIEEVVIRFPSKKISDRGN